MNTEKAYRQLTRWVKRIISDERTHPETGVVNSVDGRLAEVQPDHGGPPIDCRLQSVEKGENGLVLKPKKDSTVIFEHMDKETAVLVATMDVEEVLLDCDTITINGGDNDGIPVYPELRKELETEKARLSAVIKALSNVPTATETGGSPDGGTAYKSGIKAALAAVQEGDYSRSAIKDDKFTH